MAKRNKMLRKVLVTMCSAVLLVGATVGVTVAYLTSKTEVVTNTFTVGNVEITLDEANVDVYGNTEGTTRVTANDYKLIPGHTYVKDPTIHVEKGSEACYLFVKVINDIADIEADTKIAAQMATNGWVELSEQENVYYLNRIINALDAENDIDVKVFESFKLDGSVANEVVAAYAGKTITVQAYAVQADGFGSAALAWASAPATWGATSVETEAESN